MSDDRFQSSFEKWQSTQPKTVTRSNVYPLKSPKVVQWQGLDNRELRQPQESPLKQWWMKNNWDK